VQFFSCACHPVFFLVQSKGFRPGGIVSCIASRLNEACFHVRKKGVKGKFAWRGNIERKKIMRVSEV
jgi:hypothetical protein